MHRSTSTLPIRLVPRRRKAAVLAVFYFLLGSVSLACASYLYQRIGQPAARMDLPLMVALWTLSWLFAVVAGLSLLWSGIKLLPRSPLLHIEIARDGILVRNLLDQKAFAWPAISAFAVVKRGWRRQRLLAAFWADELEAAESGQRTIKPALTIAPNAFLPGGAASITVFAHWLNELRERSVLGQLDAHDVIEVPAIFGDNTIARPPRLRPLPTQARDVRGETGKRSQTIVRS